MVNIMVFVSGEIINTDKVEKHRAHRMLFTVCIRKYLTMLDRSNILISDTAHDIITKLKLNYRGFYVTEDGQ